MARKSFPVARYIGDVGGSQSPESSVTQSPQSTISMNDEYAKAEFMVHHLADNNIDITADYNNWVSLAAAFSSAFSEGGRNLFHGISQSYGAYSFEECDKLYTDIMKNNKNRASLGTFYHLCKEHGVDVNAVMSAYNATLVPKSPESPKRPHGTLADDEVEEEADELANLKPFSKKIEKDLPEFIRDGMSRGIDYEEKDTILLVMLCILASAFGKKVKGKYGEMWVYSTLNLLVIGQAGSRKSIVSALRNLVRPINQHYRDKYKEFKAEYDAKKAKAKESGESAGDEPKKMMHNIPANSSAAAIVQVLDTMKGLGLIIDTEIDTMVQTFKQDWGNFSEIIRKMFHHETVEIYRKTNDEYTYVDDPAASIVLSGTVGQFKSLISNVEDGLFSRFMMQYKKPHLQWETQRSATEDDMDHATFYKNQGMRLFKFFLELQELEEAIIFELTDKQWKKFDKFFSGIYKTYIYAEGVDIHASVVRTGLICYRIMMVLTTARIMTSGLEIPKRAICSDKDFKTAIHIAESMLPHMARFYEMLVPVKTDKEQAPPIFNHEKMDRLYKALPKKFTTAEYYSTAMSQGVPQSTAKKWIKRFCIDHYFTRIEQGKYAKGKK